LWVVSVGLDEGDGSNVGENVGDDDGENEVACDRGEEALVRSNGGEEVGLARSELSQLEVSWGLSNGGCNVREDCSASARRGAVKRGDESLVMGDESRLA
jgi:hypothetical protein